MQPQVTRITESTALGPNGSVTKVVVITYMVGSLGPFTLTVPPQQVQDGSATAQMQAFADSLGRLPLAPGAGQ